MADGVGSICSFYCWLYNYYLWIETLAFGGGRLLRLGKLIIIHYSQEAQEFRRLLAASSRSHKQQRFLGSRESLPSCTKAREMQIFEPLPMLCQDFRDAAACIHSVSSALCVVNTYLFTSPQKKPPHTFLYAKPQSISFLRGYRQSREPSSVF